MKIRIKKKLLYGYEENIDHHSLEKYADLQLDGDDYDKGFLESTRATADNVVKAFGRLLDILAEKNTLSAEDVVFIVENQNNKNVEFIDS